MKYSPNQGRREETIRNLKEQMYQYPKRKDVDFGHLSFMSMTRDELLKHTRLLQEEASKNETLHSAEKEQLDEKWKLRISEAEETEFNLREQVQRLQEYNQRLEDEKRELSSRIQKMEEKDEEQSSEKEEEINYLKRKLCRPTSHEEIGSWVERFFSGRLLMHPKAIALLADRESHYANLDLICDALDFLATDYWERRYRRLTDDEMNSRCGMKYGRPFSVSPTGVSTIAHAPSEYKIKYFPGHTGKPTESPLEFHLRIGSTPETLIRIYFLHDDAKQLIVVGSLPKHLPAVTIK